MNPQSPSSLGTILVVDDAPDILALLELRLRRENYKVATAEDGQKALEVVEKVQPDLIISDVMMPNMNGFELLFKLRNDPEFRSIPFIFLTSRKEAPDKAIALGMGADFYVDKPFNWEELRQHVEKVFSLRNRIQKYEQEKITGLRGNIRDMPISEVLQLLEMGTKTGTLNLISRRGEANVRVLNGQPVFAKIDAYEELSMEQTLLEILAWAQGSFSFSPHEVREPSNSKIRLSSVLLKWSIKRDHEERDQAIASEVQDSLVIVEKRKIKVKIPDGSPIAEHLDIFRIFLNTAEEIRLVGVAERDRVSWISAESEREERRYVESCLDWVRSNKGDEFAQFPPEVFRMEISGTLGRVVFRPIPASVPLFLILLYPKKNPPYNSEVRELIDMVSKVYEKELT
jgi:DNA-binding response OmpR family regulator